MKKLLLAAFGIIILASCSKEEELPQDITFSLGYNVEQSSGATRAGADLYNAFYNDYVKTKLVGYPEYNLTFYKGDEEIGNFKGEWEATTITLPEGTYKVVGTSGSTQVMSQANDDNLQHSKMTLNFEEDVVISKNTKTLNLTPKYDCYLLFFNTSLFKGAELVAQKSSGSYIPNCSFTKAGGILYVFINTKSNAHSIKYTTTDNDTGTLNIDAFGFQNSKYYSLDAVATGYSVPPMDSGF